MLCRPPRQTLTMPRGRYAVGEEAAILRRHKDRARNGTAGGVTEQLYEFGKLLLAKTNGKTGV
jgi:hypothetical protein